MDYPIPAYWQDFERLTCEICKLLWNDPGAQRHGRSGQAQGGIDISGRDKTNGSQRVVVQCKKRVWKTLPSKETPQNTLTIEDIDNEIKEFINSKKKADRYIIAFTGLRDTKIQNYIDNINDDKLYPFEVNIWFWDEFSEWLNEYPQLEAKYYHDIIKFRAEYNHETLFCEMLYTAFDRPAFHTVFYNENNIDNFLQALEAIQQALTTGTLVNRDGHVQDQVRLPIRKSLPVDYIDLKKQMQKLRDYTTSKTISGEIIQQDNCLIITNSVITNKINKDRVKIIDSLNKVLAHYNVEAFQLQPY